ncbi:apolipoprotein N-acyltransferase [Algibacillus agarilyticus]|uniref:apolipoprotein N-acyltransferase n=1 Tax=Algibacillus agarilyticus TaxID=2234133 RepID=UPI000DD03813|nr:apolipoprotein N-acyltransferase [Algibacillus agarilyticus]
MKFHPNWLLPLLIIVGVLSPFAFSPHDVWFLPFVQFFILLFAIEKWPTLSGFKAGLAFGLGWFASGISWVHISLDQFGGLPLLVTLALMLVLSLYLALFFAGATWLSCRFSPYFFASRVAFFPFSFALFEWLRSWFFTGFPWLSVGYSQLDSPMQVFAPLIGEYGTSFVLILLVAVVVLLLCRLQYKQGAIVVLVSLTLIPLMQLINWQEGVIKHANVTLVQGNIKQENRWMPEKMWPTMNKYRDLSRPYYNSSDIIIWPEAAVPVIEKHAEDYLVSIDNALGYQNSALITGVVDYNFDSENYFNSLIVLGKADPNASSTQYTYNHPNRYSKHHLLPIGEFVPFQELLRPIAPLFDLPHSSFKRGDYVQPNIVANGFSILSAICYEIVFPEQIRANITSETDFILTVSNDAWFGHSVGPHQHLQIARMRALEFALPVVRVTNNGLTAIADETGGIVAKAPQFEESVLQYKLPISRSQTPYTVWGNNPIYLFICIAFLYVGFRYKNHIAKRCG